MNIFTLFLVISVIGAALIHPCKCDSNRLLFCVYEGLFLTLIATLRGNYTSDMHRYSLNFSSFAQMDWTQVLQAEHHVGLYAFVKALSIIMNNTQFFYGVLGFTFSVALGLLIFKHSKDPFLSYFLLVPLGYFAFTLTGIAQGLAISITIIAVVLILDGRNLLAAICIIFAYFCHTSAIVAVVFYFIRYLKLTRPVMIAMVLVFLICFLGKYSIGPMLIKLISYREYTVTLSNGGLAELAIYVCILLFAFGVRGRNLFSQSTEFSLKGILHKKITFNRGGLSSEDEVFRFLFLSCYFGALTFIFVPVLTEFFRVALYFTIMNIVLLPNAISSLGLRGGRQNVLLHMGVVALFLIEYLLFTNGSSSMNLYYFFWE